LALDKNGHLVRVRADEEVEVYIVGPNCSRDRVYRWSTLRVGHDHVDEDVVGWPIGDMLVMPARH
jgi:hypothetical protein